MGESKHSAGLAEPPTEATSRWSPDLCQYDSFLRGLKRLLIGDSGGWVLWGAAGAFPTIPSIHRDPQDTCPQNSALLELEALTPLLLGSMSSVFQAIGDSACGTTGCRPRVHSGLWLPLVGSQNEMWKWQRSTGEMSKANRVRIQSHVGPRAFPAPCTLVLGDTVTPEISQSKRFLDKHSRERFTDGPFIASPPAPFSTFWNYLQPLLIWMEVRV